MLKRLLVAAMFTSTVVFAVPVTYNEAVDGDLAPAGTLPVLTFDFGANSVTGTFTYELSGAFDFDRFAFSIPAGSSLTAALVTLSEDVGHIGMASYFLRKGNVVFDGDVILTRDFLPVPGIYSFGAALPLGPGTYYIQPFLFGSQAGASANYTFTFQVDAAPVPEPAGVGLAVSALLALRIIVRGVRPNISV